MPPYLLTQGKNHETQSSEPLQGGPVVQQERLAHEAHQSDAAGLAWRISLVIRIPGDHDEHVVAWIRARASRYITVIKAHFGGYVPVRLPKHLTVQ